MEILEEMGEELKRYFEPSLVVDWIVSSPKVLEHLSVKVHRYTNNVHTYDLLRKQAYNN